MNSRQPASPSTLVQIIRTFYLAIRLLFSSKVPMWPKLIPLAAILYVIFPLDFIPDFIPGLGQLDDLTIVLIAIWAFIQLCPKDVIQAMQGEAKVVDGSYRVVHDENPADAQSVTEQLPPPDRSR